jgi:hypothetical protein
LFSLGPLQNLQTLQCCHPQNNLTSHYIADNIHRRWREKKKNKGSIINKILLLLAIRLE